MTYRDFLNAIHSDPDDDAPRLEFADWLEQNGQPDRSEWIRVSCDLARIHAGDPNFTPLVIHRMECFARCRPAWWEYLSGISQNDRRGLFQFALRSKTAAVRLGKVPWLGRALDECWLEFVEIGADDDICCAVAAWKSPNRDLPLFFRLAPQVSEVGLTAVFDMPWLWGLNLPSNALGRNRAVNRLAERTDLRELSLELHFAERELASTMMRQLSPLSLLRCLWIDGGNCPGVDDLQHLSGLNGLRLLAFSRCVSLTDDGLVHLHSLTGLKHLYLQQCDAITDAGVEAIYRVLPSLQVKRN